MSEDHTHQQLYTPVRDNACGCTLRLFRNRDGSRCTVAFTTPERLTAVLGAGQIWVELAEPALRDMVRPLGVQHLVVDPNLIAPPVTPQPQHISQPARPVVRPAATLVGATGLEAALPRR